MAPTKDYAKYLRASMKAQRAYIRSEQKRMTEARRLYDLYNAAMGAIELHPLSVTEIVDRQKQLEQMGRDIAKTHGDGPGQRAWFKQQCSTTSQDTPAPSVAALRILSLVRDPDRRNPNGGGAVLFWGEPRDELCAALVALSIHATGELGVLQEGMNFFATGNDEIGRVFADPEWRQKFEMERVPQPKRVSLGDTSNTDPSPQTTPPAQSAES